MSDGGFGRFAAGFGSGFAGELANQRQLISGALGVADQFESLGELGAPIAQAIRADPFRAAQAGEQHGGFGPAFNFLAQQSALQQRERLLQQQQAAEAAAAAQEAAGRQRFATATREGVSPRELAAVGVETGVADFNSALVSLLGDDADILALSPAEEALVRQRMGQAAEVGDYGQVLALGIKFGIGLPPGMARLIQQQDPQALNKVGAAMRIGELKRIAATSDDPAVVQAARAEGEQLTTALEVLQGAVRTERIATTPGGGIEIIRGGPGVLTEGSRSRLQEQLIQGRVAFTDFEFLSNAADRLADEVPAAFGFTGDIGGIIQGLSSQSRIAGEALSGLVGLGENIVQGLNRGQFKTEEDFTSFRDRLAEARGEAEFLVESMAFAIARLNEPGGKLSNQDVESARRAISANDLFDPRKFKSALALAQARGRTKLEALEEQLASTDAGSQPSLFENIFGVTPVGGGQFGPIPAPTPPEQRTLPRTAPVAPEGALQGGVQPGELDAFLETIDPDRPLTDEEIVRLGELSGLG